MIMKASCAVVLTHIRIVFPFFAPERAFLPHFQLFLLVVYHAVQVIFFKFFPPIKKAQFNQNRNAYDTSAKIFNQLATGIHGSAGSQQVINKQTFLATDH